ncbi:MAG: xanthine dehydrogenase family protein subunit M [Alphaproteobacteria bacterium]|nr:MAG: xanthine dehydrogenase family protein subunit M [Alphaproteobacteria bacterium]
MYNFNYVKADSVQGAADALSAADDGKYLAGGMTLLPTMKQRLAAPTDLIDLGGIGDLAGISVDGGTVTIGATTTHATVAASAEIAGAIPALAKLASEIGDPQVRNRGTIGGSVANSDPSADYPAAIVALGATIVTNKREIAGDDYFLDIFETALEEDEIITAVKFPVPEKAAYIKFPNPASRYAVVGVFICTGGGDVRVGVTGAGPCAYRATDLEDALKADFSEAAVDGVTIDGSSFNADMHASAEFRANLVSVGAKRAVVQLS